MMMIEDKTTTNNNKNMNRKRFKQYKQESV